MKNAEALFFVDHYQAEIFKTNVTGNKPMRPDDDVDTSFAQ